MLCMASAMPVAAGGAIALQKVGSGVNGAIEIAQNMALLEIKFLIFDWGHSLDNKKLGPLLKNNLCNQK